MILKAVAALTAITGNGPERFRTGLEGSQRLGRHIPAGVMPIRSNPFWAFLCWNCPGSEGLSPGRARS